MGIGGIGGAGSSPNLGDDMISKLVGGDSGLSLEGEGDTNYAEQAQARAQTGAREEAMAALQTASEALPPGSLAAGLEGTKEMAKGDYLREALPWFANSDGGRAEAIRSDIFATVEDASPEQLRDIIHCYDAKSETSLFADIEQNLQPADAQRFRAILDRAAPLG